MNCPKVFLSIDILSILSSVEPSGVPLNQSILEKKTKSVKVHLKTFFWARKKIPARHSNCPASLRKERRHLTENRLTWLNKLFAYWIVHSRYIKFSLAARTLIGCNAASNFRAQRNSQSKTLPRSFLRYVSYVNFSGPVSEVSRSPTLKRKTLGGLLGVAIEMKYV